MSLINHLKDLRDRPPYGNNDDDDSVLDFDESGMVDGQEPGDGTLEGGINAYVEAIKSKNAPQRGQRGKLKFKNVRGDDEMDIDEDDAIAAKKKLDARSPGKHTPKRRGLGGEKAKSDFAGDGKIHKSPGRAFKHGLQSRRGKGKR